MTNELSYFEKVVFGALNLEAGQDVPIDSIFEDAYSGKFQGLSVREKQQRLSPTFTRINNKLAKGKIVPGKLKQTYKYDPEAT